MRLAEPGGDQRCRGADKKDDKKDDKKKQGVSAKVAKPLKAAQEALSKEQWDEAMVKIREAQAIEERSPYDDFQINEFLAFASIKKGDYATAATALESVLDSGFLAEELVNDRTKQLAQLNFQIKSYPKAIEFGKRWMAATPDDPYAYELTGQAQYLIDDNAGAIQTLRGAVDAAKRSGTPVKEQWLQVILSAHDRTDDAAGVSQTLQELVAAFPTPKYWEQVLDSLYTRPDNDDRTTLEIHRLRSEVGVLKRPDDYVEMSDIAAAVGVPAEAAAAMEKALSAETAQAKDRERRQQRLTELKRLAESDRKSLPGLEKDSATAKSGDVDYALGVGYLSFAQYDQAAAALKRAVQKGGLKRPDEAQLALGRALLKANQIEEAKRAFAAVPESSKLARIAQLWAIYAGQQA
ncbi:MAG: tetratricopeptide repeat protein [Gammaproteobacteria bacterium]|nr:tetratricopeptide repeat protein [Gammaproteobacteria bacterium]